MASRDPVSCRRRRDQGAGLVAVQADRVPRRPRRTPIRDLPDDPAGSAEGFAAADFGRGPALPNRLSQAPGHQPTNTRFCRIESVTGPNTMA